MLQCDAAPTPASRAEAIRTKLRMLLFEGEVVRLMSLAFLTKPIGLVSQILMAKYFGASLRYDAYVLAYFLVNFLTNIMGQVFSAVTIPYLAEQKAKLSERELKSLVNALLAVSTLPSILFTLLVAVKASWLVSLAAPEAAAETQQLAARMLRWMAIPSILLALAETLKSTLNAYRAFRIPATMPMINSVVTLAVLLGTHERLGIWSLPVAFISSSCVQLLVIASYAVHRGIITAIWPRARRVDLHELWSRSWMVLAASVLLVVNNFTDKIFASGLVAGSISAIAYANTLMNLGMQVFQFSLVTVMFTRMSEYLANNDMNACNRYLDENLRRLARFAVPVCLAAAVASFEVIRVLFQRSAFSADDTARTASALSMYMLGLPAFLVNLVIARVFHALKRLRDKIWLSAQFLATTVIGNLLLVDQFKVMGLAISTTLAINLHLALSLIVLARYRTGLEIGFITRGLVFHYLVGTAAWLAYHLSGYGAWLTELGLGHGRWTATGIAAGRAAFIFAAYGLILMLRRRFFPRPPLRRP